MPKKKFYEFQSELTWFSGGISLTQLTCGFITIPVIPKECPESSKLRAYQNRFFHPQSIFNWVLSNWPRIIEKKTFSRKVVFFPSIHSVVIISSEKEREENLHIQLKKIEFSITSLQNKFKNNPIDIDDTILLYSLIYFKTIRILNSHKISSKKKDNQEIKLEITILIFQKNITNIQLTTWSIKSY